jgi:WD40 repeat protein
MVSTVAALPVGRAFLSADWDGALLGWLPYTADDFGGKFDKNLSSGGLFGDVASVMRAARKLDRGISSLTVSEDGTRIVVGSEDGAVELWNVKGFNLVGRLEAHRGRVVSVSTNRDGSVIVSVGRDSNVTVLRAVDDPMHLIRADSLPRTLANTSSQRVDNVKSALLLSSGDILITTAAGGLGELKIDHSTQAATLANTQQSQTPAVKDGAPSPEHNRLENDSDY